MKNQRNWHGITVNSRATWHFPPRLKVSSVAKCKACKMRRFWQKMHDTGEISDNFSPKNDFFFFKKPGQQIEYRKHALWFFSWKYEIIYNTILCTCCGKCFWGSATQKHEKKFLNKTVFCFQLDTFYGRFSQKVSSRPSVKRMISVKFMLFFPIQKWAPKPKVSSRPKCKACKV